jgi:hypothetical protein
MIAEQPIQHNMPNSAGFFRNPSSSEYFCRAVTAV